MGESQHQISGYTACFRAEKGRLVREGATRFSTLAVNLGVAQAEAVSALQAAWPASDETSKGGSR